MKSASKHLIQNAFADMAKRRVPEIVPKADSLDQIFVEIEPSCDRTTHLRNFDDVRQPSCEMVALRSNKHLTLVLEPPERVGVDDSITVSLKFSAGGSRVFRDISNRIDRLRSKRRKTLLAKFQAFAHGIEVGLRIFRDRVHRIKDYM